MIVVMKETTYQQTDHLSHMLNEKLPKGVDLLDAYLFNLKMIPKWSEQYVPLMMTISQFNILLVSYPLLTHKREARFKYEPH